MKVSQTRYRIRSQDLEWRLVEGDIVALDLRSSQYLTVNASGAVLWKALIDGATMQDLCRRLVETFSIDEVRAAEDSNAFIAGLAEQGLLDVSDDE
jgi:hypothetical protein